MAERYDIDARIADSELAEWKKVATQKVQLRAMLQNLLSERCKLAVHRETKDKSVYALVIGKNGPKVAVAESADAEAIRLKHRTAVAIPDGGGMFSPGKSPGSVEVYGALMETLALLLSQPAGRPVIDRTGLTGRYDLTLERMQQASDMAGGPDAGASIFSVVQDQLGLKLETQKNDVEILVIDHIERPTEN